MAPLVNAKGQPVKMSFFDLFGPSTPSRDGKGTPRLERKKPKKEESSSTETSPQSTVATEAPTESPKPTESGPAEWTRIEEMALVGMKAQSLSWKDIGEALPGKDIEDIKRKYRELYAASVKPKEGDGKKEDAKKENEKSEEKEEKKEDAYTAEGSKKERAEGKKKWKHQKAQKAQKDKGKAEEAKPEEAKVEEAKAEEKKGILKAKATAEEKGKGGELKSINGHPVIFVDDEEELEFEELLYLFGLNLRCDEQKWIIVDSRFFDRFGKRIGAEKLKEKLAGTC